MSTTLELSIVPSTYTCSGPRPACDAHQRARRHPREQFTAPKTLRILDYRALPLLQWAHRLLPCSCGLPLSHFLIVNKTYLSLGTAYACCISVEAELDTHLPANDVRMRGRREHASTWGEGETCHHIQVPCEVLERSLKANGEERVKEVPYFSG